MKKTRSIFSAFVLAMTSLLVSLLITSTLHSQTNNSPEVIQVTQRANIKVVYQIKTNDWSDNLGEGLVYIKKLVQAYDAMGIKASDRQISAVFHGDAAYWMLKDQNFNQHMKVENGNPNAALIQELIDGGVSLELCQQTMLKNGWTAGDILPQVKIVVGAYPRIIDLQAQGYAYIRF